MPEIELGGFNPQISCNLLPRRPWQYLLALKVSILRSAFR
jgi:hypothetical protein